MLSNFKHLVKLSTQVIRKCELRSSFYNEGLLGVSRCDFCLYNQKLNFHTGMPRMKFSPEEEQKRTARVVAKEEGKVLSFEGDLNTKRKQGYFPTLELPNTLFDGVPFKELPIVSIIATRNNTHLTLLDQGLVKLLRSCGMDGFKNTRKGTNMAGQTVGTSFGFRAVKRGYKNVRVIVNGLGPGRLSAIKGLQLSGMNVVSITDKTVDAVTNRPRKQRRL